MADGKIPEDQRKVLLELGQWMRVNGEGIYSTRPWITFGEGPTKEPEGGFKDRQKFLNLQYSAADIRYTHSKDGSTLYAIVMGWPETSFTLKSLSVPTDDGRINIQLIGSRAKVEYTINDDGTLTIHPPTLETNQRPCQHAYVFKIKGLNTP
jgi:alpha-L-fucosidase